MRSSAQIVGIVLMAAGVVVAVLLIAWLAAGLADDGGLEASGAVLGGFFGFIFLVAPLFGAGVFAFLKGRRESATLANVQRQRKMLGIIEAAGEISISDLALEMGSDRDTVRADLYDLVSKGLFAGYVNWDRNQLFARQASELRGRETCPNCGAPLALAGKGLIRCPNCGTEIFLP
jgi:ribosomal protein S27AE